ncbi:ApeA N-terminal domain 1-containing protein [Nocardiopsis dassonvillei]|uniref:ApeA N-terminal domain 1-containing protein n=1 Tax=Nocardiopsis dassonvillei TaxID=2014 RepID=UPI0012FDA2A0|nr:HEPN domain-containing protein [Nocardiopsis dassonvillei]
MKTTFTEMDSVRGIFWPSDDPENRVAGLLTVGEGWPKLELMGNIMPNFIVAQEGNSYASYKSAPMSNSEMIIHGVISDSPSRVTLVGAHIYKSKENFFGHGLSEQSLTVDRVYLGAHIPSKDFAFKEFRFSVQRLGLWSALPGVGAKIALDHSSFKLEYARKDFPSVEISSPTGTIEFDQKVSFSPPTAQGGGVRTSTWLKFISSEGMTAKGFKEEIAAPVSNLLTYLFDKECKIGKMEVRHPDVKDGAWIETVDYASNFSEDKIEYPILPFEELGIGFVGSFVEVCRRLHPLPNIISSYYREPKSLEGSLIQLATSAEGLHRSLYPDSRRFSVEDVEKAAQVMRESCVGSEAKEAIARAVEQYLWEYSYPQRLEQLAEDVRAVAVDATGKTNKWKKAVTDARVSLAHGMKSKPIEEIVNDYVLLTRSLKWVLALRVIMETDIDRNKLKSALGSFEPYRAFTASCRKHLPKIYPVSSS